MGYNPLEVIVTIFVVLAFIKIVLNLSNKRKLLKYEEHIHSYKNSFLVILIILGGIVFYFLLQELTIVQILAAVSFACILFAIGLLQYQRESVSIMRKTLRHFTPSQIVYFVVWVILMAWAVHTIFF